MGPTRNRSRNSGYSSASSAPSPPVDLEPEAPSSSPPPRGLGLLVPGVVLLGAGLAVALIDVIDASMTTGEGAHGYVPLSIIITPITSAVGLPLTVVGGLRHHRYRQWRARQAVRVAPRGAGLVVAF